MTRRFFDRLNALRGVEQGFTLMELLVAMVILSILAATASQYYLHHRRKAWDAQVRASVRHMAGAENHFVYGQQGAPAYTNDLDDLHFVGYRWNDNSVRPYVALATRETFCIQVHSAHDPSIVWHFNSSIGRPGRGPATPQACGDPQVLGTYIAGLPPASAGRDGRLSILDPGSSTASAPESSNAASDGDASSQGGATGTGSGPSPTGGATTDGSDSATDTSITTGSHSGSASTGTTSDASPSGAGSGCTGGGDGSDSGSGNHPSGKDRDGESGGSGSQGSSGSDPDGNENGGDDKPGADGGADTDDQDGNNGSGNDSDFEDDNKGPNFDGKPGSGASC